MNCHLLIPGLFPERGADPALYTGLELPALETLLARGERAGLTGTSLERWLAATFNIAGKDELPLAAPALLGEGGDPGADCWIHADPVHLQVHRDELALVAAGSFDIAAHEAAEMTAALTRHFAPDGLEFVAPVPQRWYARVRAEPLIRTTPTAEAAGSRIESALPAGADGPRWRRIANEAQMLLHQLPCNEAREARGEPPVNGVWFWGAGRMPALPRDPPYATVWAAHPLALGLAAATGALAQPLPPSAAQLLAAARAAPPSGPALVVIDRLRAVTDADAWRAALAELERSWFAPLLDGLRQGMPGSLTLHAPGRDYGCSVTATRLGQLRFWRTRRRLFRYPEMATR